MQTQLEQKMIDQKIKELIHTTPPTACKCGCVVFKQGFGVRVVTEFKLSLAGLPSKGDLVANIPILYCAKCLEPLELKPESKIIGGAS